MLTKETTHKEFPRRKWSTRVLGGSALRAQPQQVCVQHTLVWEKPVIWPIQALGGAPRRGLPSHQLLRLAPSCLPQWSLGRCFLCRPCDPHSPTGTSQFHTGDNCKGRVLGWVPSMELERRQACEKETLGVGLGVGVGPPRRELRTSM